MVLSRETTILDLCLLPLHLLNTCSQSQLETFADGVENGNVTMVREAFEGFEWTPDAVQALESSVFTNSHVTSCSGVRSDSENKFRDHCVCIVEVVGSYGIYCKMYNNFVALSMGGSKLPLGPFSLQCNIMHIALWLFHIVPW